MAISFREIGQTDVSFLAADTVTAGSVCKLTQNDTVGGCSAGDSFCGVVRQVRSGVASVILTGYAELPYTGKAPSVGYQTLAADGTGGVKSVTEGGRSLLVVRVDTTNATVGVFL